MLLLVACGEAPDGIETPPEHRAVDAGVDPTTLPYATSVQALHLGEGAGFGADKMPYVVLGPPQGHGVQRGSLDVLSLGQGGQIILGFEPRTITDGPGVDFIVFENAFWPNGNPDAVFAELGRVDVSQDGETWHRFDCQHPEGQMPRQCAGWSPTRAFNGSTDLPLSIDHCGGDGFDLAELGLQHARYVRITDASLSGDAPSAGFDLDAVGLVHYR